MAKYGMLTYPHRAAEGSACGNAPVCNARVSAHDSREDLERQPAGREAYRAAQD